MRQVPVIQTAATGAGGAAIAETFHLGSYWSRGGTTIAFAIGDLFGVWIVVFIAAMAVGTAWNKFVARSEGMAGREGERGSSQNHG